MYGGVAMWVLPRITNKLTEAIKGHLWVISEAIAMQCLCKHLKNAVQAEPHFCLWAYLNAVIYFLAAVYSTNLSRFISSATKDKAYFYALG